MPKGSIRNPGTQATNESRGDAGGGLYWKNSQIDKNTKARIKRQVEGSDSLKKWRAERIKANLAEAADRAERALSGIGKKKFLPKNW